MNYGSTFVRCFFLCVTLWYNFFWNYELIMNVEL